MVMAPGRQVINEGGQQVLEPGGCNCLIDHTLKVWWAISDSEGQAGPHKQLVSCADTRVLLVPFLNRYLPEAGLEIQLAPDGPLPYTCQYILDVRQWEAIPAGLCI